MPQTSGQSLQAGPRDIASKEPMDPNPATWGGPGRGIYPPEWMTVRPKLITDMVYYGLQIRNWFAF